MNLRVSILEELESLEDLRASLEKKLLRFESDLLKIKEGEGKWSVNQVLRHLSDSEFGILRYIQKKMQGMESLKRSDMVSEIRSKLLEWFLNSPLRYKMPRQLPEPSNDLSYEVLKTQFEKNRSMLKQLIEEFPEDSLDKLIFKHPFAGRFSLRQTIGFMRDHYRHHMRQIDRILRVVEYKG